jgi:uncharacterized protein
MPSNRPRLARLLLPLTVIGGVIVAGPPLGRAALAVRAEYLGMHPERHPVLAPADSAQLGLTTVRLVSARNDSIAGWYVPSRNGASLVLAHGTQADRRQLLPAARVLLADGFGVLLLDTPGRGGSSGRVTLGVAERDAVQAAVAFLSAQPDVRRGAIGVYGFSAGALAVLQAAARDTRIRAIVVSHCPPDLLSATRREYAGAGRLAQWSALAMLRWRGIDLVHDQPIDLLPQLAPRPVLVMGGTDDPMIPFDELQRLASSSQPHAALWIIRGAGHEESVGRDSLTAQTVRDFLARALHVHDRSASTRG